MECKLLLFDLDGTLFNTNDVNYNAYNEALSEKNYSLDYDYYCKECNGRHYKVFLPAILNNDEYLIEYVHNRKKELYSKHLDKAIANIHLFNIAKSLKNEYYLAVVTTASKKNACEILKHFGYLDLFDLVLTNDDISKPKPDPEGFLKAMNYFNVDAKNTIIFEDSETGVKAANKTGATVFIIEKFGDNNEK